MSRLEVRRAKYRCWQMGYRDRCEGSLRAVDDKVEHVSEGRLYTSEPEESNRTGTDVERGTIKIADKVNL